MAKKRRSAAQRAATRKMLAANARHRRNGSGGVRRKAKRRRARAGSASRRPTVVVVRNPSGGTRRRRHARRTRPVRMMNPRRVSRRHRRRRNPGFGGALRQVFGIGVPAVATAGAIGFLDAKFLSDKSTIIRVMAKVGAAGLLGVLLRKRPQLACATMAATLGTLGYEGGVSAAGGLVASATPAGMKGLVQLVASNPHTMGYLTSVAPRDVSLGRQAGIPSVQARSALDFSLG